MAVSLSIGISQNSQSIQNNTSNVTVVVYVSWNGGSWNGYQKPGYVIIDGGQYNFTSSFNTDRHATGSQAIWAGTVNVNHAADGTKTLYCSASYTTGVSSGTITASASQVLTTIPRATTPVLSVSSVDMGENVTITLDRAASTFTHKLTYAFGSLSEQTSGLSASSDVATSAIFTPPLSLATQIPNAESGNCTITCQTYNGSTWIGTKTVSLTLNVPKTVVPTISNVAISEAAEGIAAKFEAYVQSKSKLAVAITASGASGSTISKYETYIQSTLYRGNSFTSDVITASGTVELVTTVTDSRGRTAKVSNSVTIVEYSPPSIGALSAWRITSAGEASDEGNRIALQLKYAISSVNGKNDRTYNFKYRKSTDAEFTSFASGTASVTYDDTQYFTSAPNISPDYAYIVRVEIADYFQTTVYEVQIPTAFTIMDFRNTGKGMAIGKVSERDALEVAMNSEFTGQVKIYAPGKDTADLGFIRMYRSDGTLSAILATSDGGNGLNLNVYNAEGTHSGVLKITPNGKIDSDSVAFTNPLPISSGGTNAADAASARTNLAVAQKPKLLWSGSWSSGSITVPDFPKYKLFFVQTTDGDGALCWVDFGLLLGGGLYPLTGAAGQMIYNVRASVDGNTLTLENSYAILRPKDSINAGQYTRTVKTIYGLLLNDDVL